MRKVNTKLATKLLATETIVLDFPRLKGFIKDLIGDAGYQATAQDLFDLTFPSVNRCSFEKLLIVVTGDSPVECISVTKLGPSYTLQMSKKNGSEFLSKKSTTLINMVEEYTPEPVQVQLDSIKGKNLARLKECIDKAEKEKGRNATVKDVFRFLLPDARIGIGRYTHHTPRYELVFNGFLGQMIVEIIDWNGFKRSVTNARELRAIIS